MRTAWGARRGWLAAGGVVVAVAAVAVVVAVRGGDDETVRAGGSDVEVRLEPVGVAFDTDLVVGLDLRPPGAALALALPDVPPLGSGLSALLAGIAVSGDEPGLYGGSRDVGTCDVDQLVEFLTDPANRPLAEAWAAVHGIDVDDIASFVATLTPVRLRFDTRVTNHGFADGRATPIQSVLQAGTAVLVDDRGVPRAKCACGNPLLPPAEGVTAPATGAGAWEGFDAERVVDVEPGDAFDAHVLVDVDDGVLFARPVGTDGGADRVLPASDALCATFAESPTCTGAGFAPDIVVPDVAGSDAAAARRLLGELGFVGDISERPEPSDAPAGVVVGTDPPAGREVPAKSPITLVVSTGPAPTTTSTTAAASTTTTRTPRVSTTTTSTSTTSTSTSTTAPPQVQVPNVIGETEQAAVAILDGGGLQAQTQFTPNAPPGIVGFQNPNPGATVAPGSVVTIFVGE